MANKRAKKDYDKDGKVESPADEYRGVKGRAIRKAKAGSMSKTKTKAKPKTVSKKNITESAAISKFINSISSKNYAEANKYLKGVIKSKLEARINSSLNEPLF